LYSDSCNRLSGHHAALEIVGVIIIIIIIIVIIIDFWDFLWSLLCYTLVSVLVLGIGIARDQYYWVLDIGCLSWYRSNPSPIMTMHVLLLFTTAVYLLFHKISVNN